MKKGFTLTEVLITIGIIGIIGTLTIPRVLDGVNNKIHVSQLQRTYNELRTGIVKYLQENETDKISDTPLSYVYELSMQNLASPPYVPDCPKSVKDEADPTSPTNLYSTAKALACMEWAKQTGQTAMGSFLVGYLDVAVNCTNTDKTECVAGSYMNMQGTTKTFPDAQAVCVTLSSGASVCMKSASKTTIKSKKKVTETNLKIYVDVNGKQPPNRLGRDAFVLEFSDEGKIAEAFTAGVPSGDASKCITSDDGTGCFTKIVADGWVMNY